MGVARMTRHTALEEPSEEGEEEEEENEEEEWEEDISAPLLSPLLSSLLSLSRRLPPSSIPRLYRSPISNDAV